MLAKAERSSADARRARSSTMETIDTNLHESLNETELEQMVAQIEWYSASYMFSRGSLQPPRGFTPTQNTDKIHKNVKHIRNIKTQLTRNTNKDNTNRHLLLINPPSPPLCMQLFVY